MENSKTVLRVHKVHPKHNGGYTVGMVIENVMSNGMKCTKYASIKYTKRPKVGSTIEVNAVRTELNKEGFSWITEVEMK